MSTQLIETIESAFRGDTPAEEARDAVSQAIALLDAGEVSLAEQQPDGSWNVNGWIQQAILLFFRQQQMEIIELGPFTYHDKVPLKSNVAGVRIVPVKVGFTRFWRIGKKWDALWIPKPFSRLTLEFLEPLEFTGDADVLEAETARLADVMGRD